MDRRAAERLMELYARLGDVLNQASHTIGELPDKEEQKQLRRGLGNIIALVRIDLMRPILREFPDLDADKEIPEPLPPLSPEQLALVSQLREDDMRKIDEALIAEADTCWRKVARVVGFAMGRPGHISGIPDIFYAERVRKLVAAGRLESQGNLDYLRFSEVRLPKIPATPPPGRRLAIR